MLHSIGLLPTTILCCVTSQKQKHLNYTVAVAWNVTDIQGDSEGICNTLGNGSMCDSKQKSSHEHESNFERLRSYDRLKLRIEGNDYWQ